MFKDLKQRLIQFILKIKKSNSKENHKKDDFFSELEAIKLEIEKIKNEYEKRISSLEKEILKIKSNNKMQPMKMEEKLKETSQFEVEHEELKLTNDIEELRKEVLQILEELEKE